MEIAPALGNEQDRLRTLNDYLIYSTMHETDLDGITRMASEICGTSISFVSIIDDQRELFISRYGSATAEIPLGKSFGTHTINSSGGLLVVNDLSKDSRFNDNPMVAGSPHIIFYAGMSLVSKDGTAFGTLSVLDSKPGALNEKQVRSLQVLARQIAVLFELRKNTEQLFQSQTALRMATADLDMFTALASHDLKSPLNNIISITHLLNDDYGSKLDIEGNEYVTFLNESAYKLSDLVNNILNYLKASQLSVEHKEPIHIAGLMDEVMSTLHVPENCIISYGKANTEVFTSRTALRQIFMSLFQNSIKHNDKPQIFIDIAFHENEQAYLFEVKDNGIGIAQENNEKIFELSETLHNKRRDNIGIGLSVVKRLVEKLGGEIKITPGAFSGTTFTFSIPK